VSWDTLTKTNVKTLHGEVVKSRMFNFMKVKMLMFFIKKKKLFLLF